MPYINESRSRVNGGRVGVTSNFFGGSKPVYGERKYIGSSVTQESQYGFRSAGELESANTDLIKAQNAARGWGDGAELLAHFDRLERAHVSPSTYVDECPPVHIRRYSSSDNALTNVHIKVKDNQKVYYSGDAAVRTSCSITGISPTENEIKAIGSRLIRDSRPTKPHSQMGQWFGEIRDTKSLVKPPQMPPEFYDFAKKRRFVDEVKRFRRGGAATGSAYLAGQFGWLPFVGEVIRAADATLQAEQHLTQWVRDSGRIIKRSRSEVLDQGTFVFSSTYVGLGQKYGTAFSGSSLSSNGVHVSHGWYKGIGLSNLYADIETTVAWTTSLRAGARFQYFAADPDGTCAKAKRAAQELKLLYGDPLMSLSTAWELIPWSWLADYHVDLGSLLSYQESVATDSLVARSAYQVYQKVASAVSRYTFGNYGSSWPITGSCLLGAGAKVQQRYPGSPYQWIGEPVDYSPRQWAILGALGLTKGPGTGPKW